MVVGAGMTGAVWACAGAAPRTALLLRLERSMLPASKPDLRVIHRRLRPGGQPLVGRLLDVIVQSNPVPQSVASKGVQCRRSASNTATGPVSRTEGTLSCSPAEPRWLALPWEGVSGERVHNSFGLPGRKSAPALRCYATQRTRVHGLGSHQVRGCRQAGLRVPTVRVRS